MKKIVLSLIYLFSSLFTFAQIYNIPKISFNFTTGADVTNIVSGKVIYAEKSAEKAIKSSMNIPEELADGIIIVEYTEKYYYQNEEKNRNFQLVYSNITPDQKYLKASEEKPIIIKENEILGKAKGIISLVVRARNLDPHLVLCAQKIPIEEGPFWYYGLESFDSSVAKYLLFQPITSKDTEITFPDGLTETFEHLVMSRPPEAVSSFPVMPVKFETVMQSSPGKKHEITNSAEQIVQNQHLPNMNLEVITEVHGIKVHLYFPDNFAAYFENEYKLGDPIWFYGNILYVYHNELHLYGRDFALTDPDTTINNKQNQIIMLNRQNRNAKNAKTPVNEADDYVDITQSIPKGGYAVYERFFAQDLLSPGEYKENHTNSAIEYFDKNGNRIARMFPYNDTDMIRHTQTFNYDKDNRVIEHCSYDSYMYRENGEWTVDPKRSRLFIKDVTEYKDTNEGYEAITTTYRYSYKPTVERLDQKTFRKYNSKGILLRSETKHISDYSPDALTEYDEKGNIIYDRGFGEEKYEYKYEYVYAGDKILTKKTTNLLSGSVTETNYKYDEEDRLIEQINEFSTTTFKYNSEGKVIETCRFDKDGALNLRNRTRYDKKSGIMLFRYEETFGQYEFRRFWYYEFSKDNWEPYLDPEELLNKLPE